MFFLPNLSSQNVSTGIAPWDFKTDAIPAEVRSDKTARDAWINNPATRHHVYTFYEGVNGSVRPSRERKDGEGNPVLKCHALVADFDSAQPDDVVVRLVNECPIKPNWIEKTLSGNWRFVWLLEEAIVFPSDTFARHFLKTFADFGFDMGRCMVGFDKPAWEAPERMWTNGCDWRKIHDEKISANVSRGWLVKASQKFNFKGKEFGTTIPLDVVAKELAKHFPKFSQWPGDFALNSQGPTFWIDASQSPKSAIVRETGIQTFSANAAKAFYPWVDLLGAQFVKQYEAESLGRAVEGIYYDGKQYWTALPSGMWIPMEGPQLNRKLKIERSVSPKPDKAGVSDVERALLYIEENARVKGAAPFVNRRPGPYRFNNDTYLNTYSSRPIAPAGKPGEAVWGPNGQFPWLCHFIDTFHPTPLQVAYLKAWIIHAYRCAYYFDPRSSLILFIAGPPGVGKTLLNRGILGPLLGGFGEATDWLLGNDNFNSELFEKPFWSVDDATANANPRTLRIFWMQMKRVAANPSFRCNEKFRKASMTECNSCLMVTCNADEESARQVPDLDQSIKDKLLLLRTIEVQQIKFPPRAELVAILERELPWLARWALDTDIPEELRGDSRYGVRAFADESLVEISRQSSRTAGFSDILEDWMFIHFTTRETKAAFWQGTSYQLHKELINYDPAAPAALRDYSVDTINRSLSQLKGKGFDGLEIVPHSTTRIWKIHRPKHLIK